MIVSFQNKKGGMTANKGKVFFFHVFQLLNPQPLHEAKVIAATNIGVISTTRSKQ